MKKLVVILFAGLAACNAADTGSTHSDSLRAADSIKAAAETKALIDSARTDVKMTLDTASSKADSAK